MGEYGQQKGQKRVCGAASSARRGREGEACPLDTRTGRGFMLLGGDMGERPKQQPYWWQPPITRALGWSERAVLCTKLLTLWAPRNTRQHAEMIHTRNCGETSTVACHRPGTQHWPAPLNTAHEWPAADRLLSTSTSRRRAAACGSSSCRDWLARRSQGKQQRHTTCGPVIGRTQGDAHQQR
jgi:hypothetical protein